MKHSTVTLAAIIALLLSLPGWALPDDPAAKAAYVEAQYKIGWGHDFDGALVQFREIADTYRGSLWGVKALLTLASYTPEAERIPIYERIQQEYAGTGWDVGARIAMRHLELGDDTEAFLDFLSQLSVEFGGPSLEEVIGGKPLSEIAEQIAPLPQQKQEDIAFVYDCIWPNFAQKAGNGLGRKEEALPISLMMRDVFAPRGLGQGDELVAIAYCLGVHPSIGDELMDPVVTLSYPSEGETTGPCPEIRAEMHTGSLNYSQIALNKIVVELDGESVVPGTLFSGSYSPIATSGEPFETLDLTFIPDEPLTPGAHTFRLQVEADNYEEGGPGLTEFIRTFQVSPNPPNSDILILDACQDSALLAKEPHQNEGSNSLLPLGKIQGRAARCAVAFDLSQVDLAGLTKATLVLTVNPDEKVTGWGNGEFVSARAITRPWVEGNGKSFGLKRRDQDPGTGPGVTWFAPIDEDISNDWPNCATPWIGGFIGSERPTRFPVRVTNHTQGQLEFDVTEDVLEGAEQGFLVKKVLELNGAQLSFYSKEGAAQAGSKAP